MTLRREWSDDRLDALSDWVDDGFKRMDKEFAKVDKRFDRMDDRFDRMDDKFGRLEGKLDHLADRFDRLQHTLVLFCGSMIVTLFIALMVQH